MASRRPVPSEIPLSVGTATANYFEYDSADHRLLVPSQSEVPERGKSWRGQATNHGRICL